MIVLEAPTVASLATLVMLVLTFVKKKSQTMVILFSCLHEMFIYG